MENTVVRNPVAVKSRRVFSKNKLREPAVSPADVLLHVSIVQASTCRVQELQACTTKIPCQ